MIFATGARNTKPRRFHPRRTDPGDDDDDHSDGGDFSLDEGVFRGRNLDNEARQFLSLTRYGQSRAISEGVPVELWINPRAGDLRIAGASELHARAGPIR